MLIISEFSDYSQNSEPFNHCDSGWLIFYTIITLQFTKIYTQQSVRKTTAFYKLTHGMNEAYVFTRQVLTSQKTRSHVENDADHPKYRV